MKRKRYITYLTTYYNLTENQADLVNELLNHNNRPVLLPVSYVYAYTGGYAPFIIGQKNYSKIFAVQRKNQKVCSIVLNPKFYHYFGYIRS